MSTRREFGKMALAGIPLASFVTSSALEGSVGAASIRSERRQIGLDHWFTWRRGRCWSRHRNWRDCRQLAPDKDAIDAMIEACLAVGFANIEYASPAPGQPQLLDAVIGQVPPKITANYANSRDALRQWRLTAPLDPYIEAREEIQRLRAELVLGCGDVQRRLHRRRDRRHVQASASPGS